MNLTACQRARNVQGPSRSDFIGFEPFELSTSAVAHLLDQAGEEPRAEHAEPYPADSALILSIYVNLHKYLYKSLIALILH